MDFSRPSTSDYIQSDDSSDEEQHENLSTEELCLKIKTFRNLCFGNKINVNNAFDIDMIGYFYSWLEKKKASIFEDSNDDVAAFQEISDYLEASAKVYSYRVDNLTETTSKLVEKFKTSNISKGTAKIDDNNGPKTHKSKRPKIMLTTSDKLKRRPNENESSINPALINHKVSSFNCNELLTTDHPSCHLNLLYFDKPLTKEMKICKDEKKEYVKKTKIDKNVYQIMDETPYEPEICSEFKGFVTEHEQVDDSDDHQLDGIEYRFDPSVYQNNSEDSVCNEPDNNELDFNTGDNNTSALDGLVECIDNVDRDYSFFNPQLLANWKGPKAWKTQAMMKALKSCTAIERKDIIENSDDNILERPPPKTTKKRNRSKNDIVEIKWLDMSAVDEILRPKLQGKEKISPRTLQKWDPLDNISVIKSSIVNVGYKFDNLRFTGISPEWVQYSENEEENNYSDAPNYDQNIDDSDESIAGTSYAMEIDNEQLTTNSEQLKGDELATLDLSKAFINDDVLGDIKTESRMDIGELKKEISDIIDEECVDTNDGSEWSSKLSFLNLLLKLRVYERDGLSIAIVFVGLLHLTNERGLKLSQEHDTVNDIEETYISRPTGKK
ncbi:condensin complex subunit 2-like [Aphis gossypii]|uniref:condensin complex subunit 2-like n=1 Tax=Aphis gossypii TaxID=80765 RepID=UPI0021592315|nr:condensin complex subunit 2-like [Aphis gossypii]